MAEMDMESRHALGFRVPAACQLTSGSVVPPSRPSDQAGA